MIKPEVTIFGPRTLRYDIDSLTVSQEVGMHDMFTAWMARPGDTLTSDLKGYPCVLKWNSRAALREMSGYVDTVTPITDTGALGGMVVIGLGTSSVMRNGSARTWRRTTPHRIAKSIVSPYRLGLITDKYVTTLDAFMQTGESDWSALARLADTTGMTLVASDTTIRIVDVRKAIGRSQGRPTPTLVNMESFVQLETLSPPGYDRYEFAGRDIRGERFAVRGGPAGGVYRHSNQNYASLEDARMAERRHEDRLRHYVRAVAEFPGRMAVRTGDVYIVEGERWFVTKCKTEIRQGAFTSHNSLELHRPLENRPAASRNADSPPSTLRGGSWVSANSFEVEL